MMFRSMFLVLALFFGGESKPARPAVTQPAAQAAAPVLTEDGSLPPTGKGGVALPSCPAAARDPRFFCR